MIGAFLTGLRDGKLLGVQGRRRVGHRPPTEYDPTTGDDTGELVQVGPGRRGRVVGVGGRARCPSIRCRPRSPGRSSGWTVPTPPSSTWWTPAGPDRLATGDRVTVRFRPEAERIGAMADIEAFVPEGGAA